MEPQERLRAERGFDLFAQELADQPESPRPEWPSAAKRIRQARQDAGLSEKEVADALGMMIQSYWDLERSDEEAFLAPSLDTLGALGRLLNLEPRWLLFGSEADPWRQTITFKEIAARLAEHIATAGSTPEEFSERIGWDITHVLTDPEFLKGCNIEALYRLMKGLGLDWVAALPTLSRAE